MVVTQFQKIQHYLLQKVKSYYIKVAFRMTVIQKGASNSVLQKPTQILKLLCKPTPEVVSTLMTQKLVLTEKHLHLALIIIELIKSSAIYQINNKSHNFQNQNLPQSQ